MDTDFHALEVYDRPRYNTPGVAKPIVLGRNVWVGAGAMILKGVKIGDNAVVAAGSVVVQNVLPNTVVLGNPARLIWRMKGPRATDTTAGRRQGERDDAVNEAPPST
jgi:acetyltransferase-like isoleucine patch superfamily enzyme